MMRRGWALALALVMGATSASEPTITTLAGGGTALPGIDGRATDVRLVRPTSVAVDRAGNVYIAEGADTLDACRVRKVSPAGTITTYAGNGTRDTGGENVPATSVSVCPVALALDAVGNLYVGEYARVRRITTGGIISTVAGTGTWGFAGDGGAATRAQVGIVGGLALDASGQIYIVDNASLRIRRVDSGGIIRTVAGSGEFQASGDGGPALSAGMTPRAVAVDVVGNVYFSDASNNTIRRVSPSGTVTRIAGKGPFRSDPLAVNSEMYYPWGLTLDAVGNLYIANQSNLVQLISPAGILKVVVGNYNDSTFSPYGAWQGYGGDDGPATAALLWEPQDVAVDAAGNLYVADTRNDRVRKVTPVQVPRVPVGVNAFRPVTPYQAATYNGPLATGDFNGDGREDVAIASGSWGGSQADPATDYRLLVFLQQADGTLAAPTSMAFTPSRYIGRLRAGDLNRDGASDLVLGTEAGLNVFLGGASGLRIGPVLRGETNAEVPASFLLGDMDRDGRADIVAWMGGRSAGGSSASDLNGVTIFYGDGQGGASRRRFLPQTTGSGELAWMDVNRDGRADLVSTWAQDAIDSGVAVFTHDGIDAFRAPDIVRLGRGGFGRGIAVGDFDGDGRLEVVVSKDQNAPNAELASFRQTSAGMLQAYRSWRVYDLPSEMVGRDMDGDGRDDLVIHHSGWSSIGYQRQIPANGASDLDVEVKYRVRTSNILYGGLAAADLNGDGCPDVALSDNNNGLQVLYGTACVATPAAREPFLTRGHGAATQGAGVVPSFGPANAGDADDGSVTIRRLARMVREALTAARVRAAHTTLRDVTSGAAFLLLLAVLGAAWPRIRRA